MRKMIVIAIREYLAAVRTRSFIVSLVMVPLLMSGSVIVSLIVKELEDTGEKRFAIVDRSPGQKIFQAIETAARHRNDHEIYDPETKKQIRPIFRVERVEPSASNHETVMQQRFELSKQVLDGKYFGFLEIGADVYKYSKNFLAPADGMEALIRLSRADLVSDPSRLRYQSKTPQYTAFSRWVEAVINEAIQQKRWADAGLPRQQILAILPPVPLAAKGLTKWDPATGEFEDTASEGQIVHFIVPAVLVSLMFMMIMVGSTPLIAGMLEEKMGGMAEVLLGSVRPFVLMMGKLLGMVGVSLTIAAVYLAAAYWAAHHYGYTDLLPPALLMWFIAFLILAVVMYGSIFVAIGAACSEWKETQTLLMPVIMLAVFPMFFLVYIIQEPASLFSTLFSFFPPATPMLMVTRQAVPPGVSWWQPLLGMLVVLAATTGCVYAAGRIFRVGILMKGKGPKMTDLLRWVFTG
jgi:ABC-2 type transport system permease protein